MNTRLLQTKSLIACCTLALVLLCSIQYYLIKNTYDLNKSKLHQEIRDSIIKINYSSKMVELTGKSLHDIKNTFYNYAALKKPLHHKDFIRDFLAINQAANTKSTQYIAAEIQKSKLLRGVKYEFRFDSIRIENVDDGANLLSIIKPTTLIGETINNPEKVIFDEQLVVSKDYHPLKIKDKKGNPSYISFKIWYSRSIDISNEKSRIFYRMAGIFIIALVLILIITILFFTILFNLIRQKKIATMKTDFANNISHELKTPLASLNIIVKSLNRTEIINNPTIFNRTLETLNRQNKRIQQVVDSVLESSIYNINTQANEPLAIDVFLREFFEDFKVESHQISYALEAKKYLILASPNKLEAVLNNILENAIKYSAPQSKIYINAYHRHDFYYIDIKDEGIGISKKEQQLIFEKFFRVPEAKDMHNTKGLGLGLYLSAKNIGEMNGDVTVVSEFGKGSTFTIKLPIYED